MAQASHGSALQTAIHRLRAGIRVVALLYIATGVIYGVARLFTGERFVVVMLGNLGLHWYLGASWVLLLLALLARAWRYAGVMALCVGLFCAVYGELFIPSVGASTNAPPLRLMTFNSYRHQTTPEELTALIDTYNPDIFGVIEADPANVDILQATFPHVVVNPNARDLKVIASQHPITASREYDTPTGRQNLQATVNIEGQEITVFLVHPPSPDTARSLNFYAQDANHPVEIRTLLDTATTDTPTILMGDFNISEQSRRYQRIRQSGFIDAFRHAGVGFGPTYMVRFPSPATFRSGVIYEPSPLDVRLTRIDYVFYSPHFTSTAAFTGTDVGSDHLPLIADLILTAAP